MTQPFLSPQAQSLKTWDEAPGSQEGFYFLITISILFFTLERGVQNPKHTIGRHLMDNGESAASQDAHVEPHPPAHAPTPQPLKAAHIFRNPT